MTLKHYLSSEHRSRCLAWSTAHIPNASFIAIIKVYAVWKWANGQDVTLHILLNQSLDI